MRATSGDGVAIASQQPLSGDALVSHVARRATFGLTPALLTEIRSSGVDDWLEQQLQPSEIADNKVEEKLRRLRDLDGTPADFRARKMFGNQVTADLQVAAVVRAVESNRHLLEVMVDLWHDHLTASSIKEPVSWHLPLYDRAAIRPHALGRFSDLLRAATMSSAMLEYLDTASSAAPKVNENHGRELLELHTVGRAAGFSQADVAGAARALSGWTLDPSDLSVTFDPARHDPAPGTVLGWSTSGRSGRAAARDLPSLLEHLAHHPSTARRIATLLARRFIADAPPEAVVASIAEAYLAAGTDLAATLRHLFATSEFRRGGAVMVRRPLDLLAAQLRATSAILDIPNSVERATGQGDQSTLGTLSAFRRATDAVDPFADPLLRGVAPQRPIASSIIYGLRHNGQPLFGASNPSGHPLTGARWSSGDALLRRWTLGAFVAQDALPGIAIDPTLVAATATAAGPSVDALAKRCFGSSPSRATRDGALVAMGCAEGDPIDDPQQLRQALAFLLAAPEMQLR